MNQAEFPRPVTEQLARQSADAAKNPTKNRPELAFTQRGPVNPPVIDSGNTTPYQRPDVNNDITQAPGFIMPEAAKPPITPEVVTEDPVTEGMRELAEMKIDTVEGLSPEKIDEIVGEILASTIKAYKLEAIDTSTELNQYGQSGMLTKDARDLPVFNEQGDAMAKLMQFATTEVMTQLQKNEAGDGYTRVMRPFDVQQKLLSHLIAQMESQAVGHLLTLNPDQAAQFRAVFQTVVEEAVGLMKGAFNPDGTPLTTDEAKKVEKKATNDASEPGSEHAWKVLQALMEPGTDRATAMKELKRLKEANLVDVKVIMELMLGMGGMQITNEEMLKAAQELLDVPAGDWSGPDNLTTRDGKTVAKSEIDMSSVKFDASTGRLMANRIPAEGTTEITQVELVPQELAYLGAEQVARLGQLLEMLKNADHGQTLTQDQIKKSFAVFATIHTSWDGVQGGRAVRQNPDEFLKIMPGKPDTVGFRHFRSVYQQFPAIMIQKVHEVIDKVPNFDTLSPADQRLVKIKGLMLAIIEIWKDVDHVTIKDVSDNVVDVPPLDDSEQQTA